MSAVPCHPALRARIAERLRELIDDGATALGRQLGHAGTTVSRRGADLSAWPTDDVLVLAQQDLRLRDALRQCLDGAAPAVGEAAMVISEIIESLCVSSRTEATALEALKDGRCTTGEARAMLDLLAERRRHEDGQLIPALRAVADRAEIR